MTIKDYIYNLEKNVRKESDEIWSKEKWISYSEEENLAADEIAERIENLGI